MIAYETKYGKVHVSNAFFAKLIGNAVTSCYGVAGMVAKGGQKFRKKILSGHALFFSRRNRDEESPAFRGKRTQTGGITGC